MSHAFEPLSVGPWTLPQRFVMAPLTRNRAGAGNAPTSLNAEYYAQRAGVLGFKAGRVEDRPDGG